MKEGYKRVINCNFLVFKLFRYFCVAGSPDVNGSFDYLVSILGGDKRCPRSCLGKGACKEGKCFCNFGFYGRDCSIELKELETEEDLILSTNKGKKKIFKIFFYRKFCFLLYQLNKVERFNSSEV